jgi:hypothetical protein
LISCQVMTSRGQWPQLARILPFAPPGCQGGLLGKLGQPPQDRGGLLVPGQNGEGHLL